MKLKNFNWGLVLELTIPNIIACCVIVFIYNTIALNKEAPTTGQEETYIWPVLPIVDEIIITEVNSLTALLNAIEQVESGSDPNAMGDYKYFNTWQDASNWRSLNGGVEGSMIYMDCKHEVNCPNPEIYIPQAIGSFQIHKIYVDDVNRILKQRNNWEIDVFVDEDRWNRAKSRDMVIVYLEHYGKGLTLLQKAAMHVAGPDGYLQMDEPNVKRYIDKIRRELEK